MDPNHSIPNLPPMTTHQAGQSPPMTTTNAHPPDAEMIIAAISGGSDITEANFYTGGVSLEDPPSGLSKRKPGRPPKLKPPSSTENLPVVAKRGRGRPPKLTGDEGVVVPPFPSTENSPVVVKRGRGRPPKSTGDEGVVPPPPSTENSPVVVKRGRGRPPKSTGGKVDASGGHVASSDAGGGGELQVVEVGSDSPVVKMGDNGVKVKRGRGRPRRFGIGPVTVPLSGNLLRPRGRPKKVAGPNVAVSGGTGEGVSGLRRRGRPSRILSGNLTGASLGKPAKGGLGTAVIVTDPQQLVVYQELKSKYELIQSKVKQMASIVKPCIDPVYENTALGVLQELEDLAGEANAPSHD